MHHCLNCSGDLDVQRLSCATCGLAYEGRFALPRLARLSAEHQGLAERILVAGGNLKDVALAENVSYPTLRKRVDALIAALEELRAADRRRADGWLEEVEAGRMTAEEAARRMREASGGR